MATIYKRKYQTNEQLEELVNSSDVESLRSRVHAGEIGEVHIIRFSIRTNFTDSLSERLSNYTQSNNQINSILNTFNIIELIGFITQLQISASHLTTSIVENNAEQIVFNLRLSNNALAVIDIINTRSSNNYIIEIFGNKGCLFLENYPMNNVSQVNF